MPKRSSIHDVRAAGYSVALASGSVEVEEAALAEAHQAASTAAVSEDAGAIAREVANLAVAQGKRGDDLHEIVRAATSRALEQIQGARDERVSFHERALEIARSSPDVVVVTALGDPETPDDDVHVYVACKPDGTGWDAGAQEILDALVASPERK